MQQGGGGRQEPRPGYRPWSRGPDWQSPRLGVGTAGAGDQLTASSARSSEMGLQGHGMGKVEVRLVRAIKAY